MWSPFTTCSFFLDFKKRSLNSQSFSSVFVQGMPWWTLAWHREPQTPKSSCWRWWGSGQHTKVEGRWGNTTAHNGAKQQTEQLWKPPQPQLQHLGTSPQLHHLQPLHLPPRTTALSRPAWLLRRPWSKEHDLSLPPPPPPQHAAPSTLRCLCEVNTGTFLLCFSVFGDKANSVLTVFVLHHEDLLFFFSTCHVFASTRTWRSCAECTGLCLERGTWTAALHLRPPPNRLPVGQRWAHVSQAFAADMPTHQLKYSCASDKCLNTAIFQNSLANQTQQNRGCDESEVICGEQGPTFCPHSEQQPQATAGRAAGAHLRLLSDWSSLQRLHVQVNQSLHSASTHRITLWLLILILLCRIGSIKKATGRSPGRNSRLQSTRGSDQVPQPGNRFVWKATSASHVRNIIGHVYTGSRWHSMVCEHLPRFSARLHARNHITMLVTH